MRINFWYISSILISFFVIIPILTVFSSFFENTSNYYQVLKFEKPKFFPKSIKFCGWYKKDALAKTYTYAYKEKEIERIAPNNPSNFGILWL